MANTSAIRIGGKTLTLSVGTVLHSAAVVVGNTNDQMNYVACLNTGTASVAIKFSTMAADSAVLAADGAYGDFVLPAIMETPILLATPPVSNSFPLYVTAIGASGTNLVYLTPMVDQA